VRGEYLDAALTTEQRQAGFYLEEDEDFLYLKKSDEVLAVFSSKGATVQSIREVADRYREWQWKQSQPAELLDS
jgi:hypothetical protein